MINLLSVCYDVILFVVLLQFFICVIVIHTSKANSFSQIYQIIVIKILKSRRYFIHYIIKFISFMSIYYDINSDIVLFFIIFSNLYIGFIDQLQVCINQIIFPFKKKILRMGMGNYSQEQFLKTNNQT